MAIGASYESDAVSRERVLYDWLHQACALLSVEARDHEDNSQWDCKKRQEIAKILRRFLVQATNVLDDTTTA